MNQKVREVNVAKDLGLVEGELLLITSTGDYIIHASDYDAFIESNVVSEGECGNNFNIYTTICFNNVKYDERTADVMFSKRLE